MERLRELAYALALKQMVICAESCNDKGWRGNTAFFGFDNFRIVIMDSGGADQKLGVSNALGAVSNGNRDAKLAQMLDSPAVLHITAVDIKTHAVQHFSQRGHGDTADTAQMDALAGGQKLLYIGTHGCSSKGGEFTPLFAFFKLIYYNIRKPNVQLKYKKKTDDSHIGILQYFVQITINDNKRRGNR